MIWWTGTGIADVVIVSVCGAVAGVGWYLGMRRWLRWWEKHSTSRL
jgi:hypothetical protein